MRLEGAQALQAALLRALRAAQGPSPGPRLPPGYLRALTAEAAPAASNGGGSAATAAEAVAEALATSSGTRAAAAAAAAEHATQRAAAAALEAAGAGTYDATVAAAVPNLSAAGQRIPRGAGPRDKAYHNRLASFEGLTQVLAQQQAVLAEANPTAAAARSSMSPALQAMTWHQRWVPPLPSFCTPAAPVICCSQGWEACPLGCRAGPLANHQAAPDPGMKEAAWMPRHHIEWQVELSPAGMLSRSALAAGWITAKCLTAPGQPLPAAG